MKKTITIAIALWAVACEAQTTVNGGRVFEGTLRSNGANSVVDFSGAGSTAPVKVGLTAARPSTCTAGQLYFATDATAGQNLSMCSGSPGSWTTAIGGSTGASPGSPSGGLQMNNGSGGLAGQAMIYSSIAAGGTEYQQGENCVKGVSFAAGSWNANATSEQQAVMTVPANWIPTELRIDETATTNCNSSCNTSSGAGGMSTWQYCLGTATVYNYYGCYVAGSSPSFEATSADAQAASAASHTIYLYLGVTNSNPGVLGPGSGAGYLTAGAVTASICGEVRQ